MPDEHDSIPDVAGKAPEFAERFAVSLFGLPLSWRDNLVCCLPVMLAIAMQLRFSSSFMAEGGFTVTGIVGYLWLRLWLTGRRYPDPDPVELDSRRLVIPACLNNGVAETIELDEISRVQLFVYRGRYGLKYSSLHIFRGQFQVKIPALAVDIKPLAESLIARGCPVQKKLWSAALPMAMLLLALLLIVALLLLRQ